MVIELFTAEGFSLIEIHRCLRNVYGEDAVDVSLVRRWVCRFKSGGKDIDDGPRRSRPATAVISETVKKFFERGATINSEQYVQTF
jgi:transposase